MISSYQHASDVLSSFKFLLCSFTYFENLHFHRTVQFCAKHKSNPHTHAQTHTHNVYYTYMHFIGWSIQIISSKFNFRLKLPDIRFLLSVGIVVLCRPVVIFVFDQVFLLSLALLSLLVPSRFPFLQLLGQCHFLRVLLRLQTSDNA